MPFDKISPQQLFIMRILTGAMFMAIGGALAYLSGSNLLAQQIGQTRDLIYFFAVLCFGVLLANAGMMLLEHVTPPPYKLAINVPFVAGNFQTALCFGLIAGWMSLEQYSALNRPFKDSSTMSIVQALCLAGFAMNLFFVMTTKLHWNFTENTGKQLPKA